MRVWPGYLPVSFPLSRAVDKSNIEESEIATWRNEAKPGKFQEINYLTAGGAIAAICGLFSTLVSGTKNAFGAFLGLVGLGVMGFGLFSGPNFNLNLQEITSRDSSTTGVPEKKDGKEKESINSLLEQLNDKKANKRRDAVKELVAVYSNVDDGQKDKILDAFIDKLQHPDRSYQVRLAIINSVSKLDLTSAKIQQLIEYAKKDAHDNVKRVANEVLVKPAKLASEVH